MTIELVFNPWSWFAGSPLELNYKERYRAISLHLVGALQQLSRALTHQFLTPASASIAWEYLIDDAKMGIFPAITSGWVAGWMVSQFCYCSLTDARADGGIGPRYAGTPEYPDSEAPLLADTSHSPPDCPQAGRRSEDTTITCSVVKTGRATRRVRCMCCKVSAMVTNKK